MDKALRKQGRAEELTRRDRDTSGRSMGSAPPAEAPFVAVRDLTKRFAQFTALDRVDLDVGKGEFVCFLGPSGCGKTTLLRAIAGLDPQTSGTITMGGRDISHAPPAERDFGIVFQSYALFPNLSIVDNVGYGLVNQRLPKAQVEARVGELLTLVGLSDQGRKYPVQLSGGQQQRVALARALATSPSLLLLDEPLSALDARVRLRLRDEIKALQRRLGVTTIMVTHDQEEALSMADRIVVMNHGVIEQVGTPEEVYNRPATTFVADFVGRMNFLKGVAEGRGKVRIGKHVLAFANGHDLAKGAAVEIGLRPEAVVLGGKGGNTITSIVREVEFLGAFNRVAFGIGDGAHDVVLADVAPAAMADSGIAVGAAQAITLPAEALRVFPARSAS
jgi:iron(III) transport system ATP-binding protein